MHYQLLHPKEYLCAADLRGKDVTLTISRLKSESLKTDRGSEDKWCLYFKEVEEKHRKNRKHLNKRLVLNKTNAKTIAKIHGPETDDWIGKRITLYGTTCTAFGEEVECIRIRGKAAAKRSAQDPSDDDISSLTEDSEVEDAPAEEDALV